MKAVKYNVDRKIYNIVTRRMEASNDELYTRAYWAIYKKCLDRAQEQTGEAVYKKLSVALHSRWETS